MARHKMGALWLCAALGMAYASQGWAQAPEAEGAEQPAEPPESEGGDGVAPGDDRAPEMGANGEVVLPGANRPGDGRPGFDPLAPVIKDEPPPASAETPLPPGDAEVQGKVPQPAMATPAGALVPAEGAGGASDPQTAEFTPPAIKTRAASAAATASGVSATPAYWPIVLAVISFAVVIYAFFWRVLMRRLDDVDEVLARALSADTMGTPQAVRLSPRRALALLGGPAADPSVLSIDGLSFGVVHEAELSSVVDHLAATALKLGEPSVVVVSPRSVEAVVVGALGAMNSDDPAQAAAHAGQLCVAGTTGQSVNSLARLVRRSTHGEGIVILEHPRWLADLDGPARASWVLARLDERLADLSLKSGVTVWVVCAQGPLAPDVKEAHSQHVRAVLNLKLTTSGLGRQGVYQDQEIDDTWEGLSR